MKRSVFNHLWQYFDYDREAIIIKPIPLIKPVDELPPTITTSQSKIHEI